MMKQISFVATPSLFLILEYINIPKSDEIWQYISNIVLLWSESIQEPPTDLQSDLFSIFSQQSRNPPNTMLTDNSVITTVTGTSDAISPWVSFSILSRLPLNRSKQLLDSGTV